MGVGSVGVKGHIGPIALVDIFHYGLFASHALFLKSFTGSWGK